MKQKLLKISKLTSSNFGEPLDYFLNFILKINSLKGSVIIDFSDCQNVSPLIIGGIVCVVNAKKEEGVKIEYILPINNYFNNIYFPNGLDYNIEEFEKILKPFQYSSFMPLIKFPVSISENNKLEELISEINIILKMQLKLKGDYLKVVQYLITHVTQK